MLNKSIPFHLTIMKLYNNYRYLFTGVIKLLYYDDMKRNYGNNGKLTKR